MNRKKTETVLERKYIDELPSGRWRLLIRSNSLGRIAEIHDKGAPVPDARGGAQHRPIRYTYPQPRFRTSGFRPWSKFDRRRRIRATGRIAIPAKRQRRGSAVPV